MGASRGSGPDRLFRDGQVLGERFRIEGFIARGGMGEVYGAEDLELGERIALKTIRSDVASDQVALRRFRREIRLARSVSHPNVCRVFDLFLVPGEGGGEHVVLTMELLQGETLARRIRRSGALDAALAESLLRQMADGLGAAHAAGVVHRDLKSDNVFLVPHGDGTRAVLTDFGLALAGEISSEGSQSTLTAHRGIAGTPAYMSPEQLEGESATPVSDLYSLGVILFEMLTGERPFTGSNPISAAYRRLIEPPRDPRDLKAELEPRLEGVILKALARDPKARFQSAAELIRALDGPPSLLRPEPPRRPGRALLAGLGTAAVAIAVAAAWWLWSGAGPDRPAGGRHEREVVGVLPFGNLGVGEEDRWFSVALAEMVSAELGAGEQLNLVPSEATARVVSDLGLGLTGSLSSDSLDRMNRLIPADLVVSGGFLLVDGDGDGDGDGAERILRVDLRAQDSPTGEIWATASATGPESELFDLVDRACRELMTDLGVPIIQPPSVEPVRTVMPSLPKAARAYARGLEGLRRGDVLEARDDLQQAVNLAPDFPLARAALARAWEQLGYSERAAAEAEAAYQRSAGLARESRLVIEARLRETEGDWQAAAEIYRSLWTFFPETNRYGLELSEALIQDGRPGEALDILEGLQDRAGLGGDPARMTVQARAHYHLSEFDRSADLAERAADMAAGFGARQLAARARLLHADSTWRWVESESGLQAYRSTLDLFRELGDRRGEADTMLALARCHRDLGDLDEAERLSRRSAGISRDLGWLRGEGQAVAHLAALARLRGDLEASERQYLEALAIAEASGDVRWQARIRRERAMTLRRLGRLQDALAEYRACHDALVAVGDRSGASAALNSVAVVLRQLGDVEAAVPALKRALELKRQVGDLRSLPVPLVNLANLGLQLGRLDESVAWASEALTVAREVGNTRHETYALVALGEASLARGDLAAARRHHELALELRQEVGEAGAVALSELALAVIELEDGAPRRAEQRASRAGAVFADTGETAYQAYALAVQIEADLAAGRLERARARAQEAAELVAAQEDVDSLHAVSTARAEVALATGDTQLAATLYDAILADAEASHSTPDRLTALLGLARVALAEGRGAEAGARAAQLLEISQQLGFGLFERDARDILARTGAVTGTGG